LSSLPPTETLKPASSTELRKIPVEPQDFTTAVVRHLMSMEFGRWGVGAKIINNDSLAEVQVQLHSNTGRIRRVGINSELDINEWFDIIIVTPNAASGQGQLELDTVTFQDAKQEVKR